MSTMSPDHGSVPMSKRLARRNLPHRNIRRDHIEQVKKLQKEGLSEDICKGAEDEIQVITDKHIALVEKHLESKEKEIMTV